MAPGGNWVRHPPQGFPRGSAVKNLPANAGDTGPIPGSGRPSGGGHGNPLQYSYLGNPMDRGAWRATLCNPMAILHPWGHKESDMT